MRVMLTALGLAVSLAGVALEAQDTWMSPRLEAGALPATPVMTMTAGEVFLEITVTDTGAVAAVTPLRTTPGFVDAVVSAVRGWRFRPAEQTREETSGVPPDIVTELVTRQVESRAFVAAVFGSPNIPAIGELPTDVNTPTPGAAYPLRSVNPGFPPSALFGDTVLVEVTIDVGGRVTGAEVIRPAAGFDEAALDAARQWAFRPARVGGRLEESYAYLVFAFRQPLGSGAPPVPGPPGRPRP